MKLPSCLLPSQAAGERKTSELNRSAAFPHFFIISPADILGRGREKEIKGIKVNWGGKREEIM